MNKKVMALAIAGALTAPTAALAQVTISGSLTVLYFQHDPDNKSVGQTSDVMQSSESELTIRSEEKLGGGNSVWFQCGTSIDGWVGGNTGGNATGMCTRNSALGFRGEFGNVFVGNWDTPTKLLQNRIRGWFSGTNALYGGGYTLLGNGASSGQANGVGNSASTAGAGNSATSMYRRQANSVNYASPNWGGFSLAAAFSAANETANIPDSVSLSPRLYGIQGMYATGPFWVGASYEAHNDYNPGQVAIGTAAAAYNGGTDDNWTIGAGFTFQGFNVRASYSDSKYETNNNGGEIKAKGYNLYADWNIAGPHTVRAAYIALSDLSGSSVVGVGGYRPTVSATGVDISNGTGAKAYTLVYSYALSKRTEISAAYNVMDNDNNASFSQGVVAASLGGKQTSFGVAVRHSF